MNSNSIRFFNGSLKKVSRRAYCIFDTKFLNNILLIIKKTNTVYGTWFILLKPKVFTFPKKKDTYIFNFKKIISLTRKIYHLQHTHFIFLIKRQPRIKKKINKLIFLLYKNYLFYHRNIINYYKNGIDLRTKDAFFLLLLLLRSQMVLKNAVTDFENVVSETISFLTWSKICVL